MFMYMFNNKIHSASYNVYTCCKEFIERYTTCTRNVRTVQIAIHTYCNYHYICLIDIQEHFVYKKITVLNAQKITLTLTVLPLLLVIIFTTTKF